MEGQRIAINQEIAMTLDEILTFHLEYYLGLRTGEEDYDDDELGGIDEEDDEDDDEDDEGHGGHKHSKNCSHKHKAAKGGDKKEGGAGKLFDRLKY